MNGTNKTSDFRRSGVTVCADPECPALKGEGGARIGMGGGAQPLSLSCCTAGGCLPLPGQIVLYQRCGEGRERPPLFCRSIGKQGREVGQGVWHTLPTLLGVAPVKIIPAGRPRTRTPQQALTRRRHAP